MMYQCLDMIKTIKNNEKKRLWPNHCTYETLIKLKQQINNKIGVDVGWLIRDGFNWPASMPIKIESRTFKVTFQSVTIEKRPFVITMVAASFIEFSHTFLSDFFIRRYSKSEKPFKYVWLFDMAFNPGLTNDFLWRNINVSDDGRNKWNLFFIF